MGTLYFEFLIFNYKFVSTNKNTCFVLTYYTYFIIIFDKEYLVTGCLPHFIYIERRFDKMNKRTYILKVLKYICFILLLFTFLVIEIKK